MSEEEKQPEVELINVTEDEGIKKQILKAGEGEETP